MWESIIEVGQYTDQFNVFVAVIYCSAQLFICVGSFYRID